ncbi:MAG: gamma-glutamyltranspeptidase / glutathione hydrolase, partial [Solirubrobacteraceae bacterium]|nr:gamma-glutamyltranspeptidase / glutathione hydrolase [Solirubrobacteraceae bacterium]
MSRFAVLAVLAVLMALVAAYPAGAQVQAPPKTPTAVGSGGAAASVDPLATQAAIDELRSGGNAVDAAVAAAGVLGVVEPFSSGVGGGGFMVIYDARRHKVDTIDSRETAPAGLAPDAFTQPGLAQPPAEDPRVGGLSVGVPGTVRGWQLALRRYGTRPLASLLRPGERIARDGFVIDQTFSDQVAANQSIFQDFPATRDLYLTPAGTAKPAGDVQKNPDLAATYERIGANPDDLYTGAIGHDIANTVQHPQAATSNGHPVRPGSMTVRDLGRYDAIRRDPTHMSYRGLDVFGMGPPSSGGSTVGEALNILERYRRLGRTREQALHRYLEASKLAFADRNEYLGDPAYVNVPLHGLLSDAYAADRQSLIRRTALPTPQPAGNPWPYNHGGGHGRHRVASGREGDSTTHLTVADRWGDIVSYTFTIEQTGGSGMVVPGRGFLLNNELTDFDFATGTANSPAPGKRPRSSIAPTMVFDHGRP